MGMVGHISDMLVINPTFFFPPSAAASALSVSPEDLARGVETIPTHDDGHERVPEGQHESHAGSQSHSHPNHHVIKKDAALIDKIEGSNTKARNSDGRPAREEKEKQLGIMNVKADLSASGSVRSTVLKEKSYSSGLLNPPHKGLVDASITDGGHEATAVGRVMSNPEETQASMDTVVGERTQSQMRGQALQGRTDYRGKGRFSSQESEEWRKKPAGKPTSVVIPARNVDAQLSMHMQDHCNFKEVPKKEESNPPDNAGTEPCVTSSVDAIDYKVQRAKMKEFATQRAKQLQKRDNVLGGADRLMTFIVAAK